MGGKKKGKKKKSKKAKKEEEPEDELKEMEFDELIKLQKNMRNQVTEGKIKRNYIQMEKDMIYDFYMNNKKELEETNAKIKNYDTEMEKMEEEHRVEKKVYMQKVKHLEYEHKMNVDRVYADGEMAMTDEKEAHLKRENDKKSEKKDLKNDLKVNDLNNIWEIEKLESEHKRELEGLQRILQMQKTELIQKYESKLHNLQNELDLRLKVEIHEIEERKNQHINDLMRNHEKAFKKMKEYYNDITKQNLDHIKAHKDELESIKTNRLVHTELRLDIEAKNKVLIEPLLKQKEKQRRLEKKLASFDKDQMSLKNAKARLQVLKEKFKETIKEKEDVEGKYKRLDKEKSDMYEKFEKAMKVLTKRTEYKNTILENKLGQLQEEFERKEVQLQEIVQRAGFDQKFVDEITKKMEEAIEAKNSILRNLKYSLAHAQKAYNDAIRVYEAKLIEFGIPAEELGLELLETNTSTMPAGLVAA